MSAAAARGRSLPQKEYSFSLARSVIITNKFRSRLRLLAACTRYVRTLYFEFTLPRAATFSPLRCGKTYTDIYTDILFGVMPVTK